MSWNRSDFSKHYKKIMVEGPDVHRLLDRCLSSHLTVRNIKHISETKLLLDVSKRDFEDLMDLAGNRYRINIVKEGGYLHKAGTLVKKKALVAGLLLFGLFMLYQSLFVAEIEVSGYESISEQDLRKTMREAGLYEGCRKNTDIDKVKLYMFEEYDNISWIGIKYKGNLVQVSIVETDNLYEKERIPETAPCNIVAGVSGYINSVDPEEGMCSVKEGEHVSEGDVLITGEIPLQKTTYEADAEQGQFMYVHAAGTVDARIPVRLNFYCTDEDVKKVKTGRKRVSLSVNDHDISGCRCPYEISLLKQIEIIDFVSPLKLKVELNICEEVTVKKIKKTEEQVKKQVINEIHKFVKENLPDNTQILNKSLNFTTEKNIINIGVTLETLQQIGKEEEIIVDKSNRKSEKNDNQ